MSVELKGKTALVTGAARGLGLLIAEDLAAEGVQVAGLDFRAKELTAQMSAIAEKTGVATLALEADLAEEAALVAAVSRAFAKWGKIDFLINNAGIRHEAPVFKTTTEDWDRIHAVNLRGQFLATREVLTQGMLARNEGTIIYISSGSGKKGEEDCSAYCASKWGLMGFAESVAKDLKNTRIRVTNVVPGMIWTPMAQESSAANLGLEWLDPKWVAQAVIWCLKQDTNTIIPEFRIYTRAQI